MQKTDKLLEALKVGVVVKCYNELDGYNEYDGSDIYIFYDYEAGYCLGFRHVSGKLTAEEYGDIWRLKTDVAEKSSEDELLEELYLENF